MTPKKNAYKFHPTAFAKINPSTTSDKYFRKESISAAACIIKINHIVEINNANATNLFLAKYGPIKTGPYSKKD